MDKKIIFLLDDDENICKLYKRMLERALPEVRVYAFLTYEDLKEHSLLSKASLFIYDIRLPGKTGDKVAMEITKINPAPVLFVSGKDYDFESFSCENLTYDFIVKDHGNVLLTNRVRVLLKVSATYECFRNEQDQLRLSLKEVFNHSNLYLLILDRNMVIKSCSSKLMQDLGYDDICDIEGKSWLYFIKAENKDNILKLHRQVFAGPETINAELKEAVTPIFRKDDTEISVKWFYSIISNGQKYSFNIGIPINNDVAPENSIEAIREYWKQAIKENNATLQAIKRTIKT